MSYNIGVILRAFNEPLSVDALTSINQQDANISELWIGTDSETAKLLHNASVRIYNSNIKAPDMLYNGLDALKSMDVIFTIDGDNVWDSTRISKHLKYHMSGKLPYVCSTQSRTIDLNGRILGTQGKYVPYPTVEIASSRGIADTNSLMISGAWIRKIINTLPRGVDLFEDALLTLLAIADGGYCNHDLIVGSYKITGRNRSMTNNMNLWSNTISAFKILRPTALKQTSILKCKKCGLIVNDTNDARHHKVITGHNNFAMGVR